jgi:CheY-like chemotaxis protein
VGNKKILIVDDNEIVGLIFKEYLKKKPYFSVEAVSDSKQALEKMKMEQLGFSVYLKNLLKKKRCLTSLKWHS